MAVKTIEYELNMDGSVSYPVATKKYRVIPKSSSAIDVQAAIQNHIEQRKAAGVDYAGETEAAPKTVTVTV